MNGFSSTVWGYWEAHYESDLANNRPHVSRDLGHEEAITAGSGGGDDARFSYLKLLKSTPIRRAFVNRNSDDRVNAQQASLDLRHLLLWKYLQVISCLIPRLK